MNTSTVHPTPDEVAARDLAGKSGAAAQPVRVAPNFLDGDEPAQADPAEDADEQANVESALPTAPSCLGLVLGMREVGYAVTSGAQLHAFGVLNIKKIQSPEGKESRFRGLVLNYLNIPQVTRIALVEPYPGIADEALVTSLLAWLNQVSVERNRTIEVCPYNAVMRTHGTEVAPATHRTLCTTLARRWPVLSRFTPEAELPVRGHLVPDFLASKLPRFASPRERYWQRAFLALGTALHAIDNVSAPAEPHGA